MAMLPRKSLQHYQEQMIRANISYVNCIVFITLKNIFNTEKHIEYLFSTRLNESLNGLTFLKCYLCCGNICTF